MIKSQAQKRLMFAAAAGKSDKVPKKVAQEFIQATPQDAFAKLKERIKKPKLGY